jgi:hypothetical protein
MMGNNDVSEINIMNKKENIWTEETEQILCRKADCSKCMARLCTSTGEYYQRHRTYLLVPAASLSWGLTIFGIIATYLGNNTISEPLIILINGLLNFIIATFTTVAEKSQAGSKVELFQQLSRDYYSLANDIGQELVKSPETRPAVTNFMKNADTRYRDLEKSTPPIPRQVVTFFIRQEQFNPGWDTMYKPDILSTLIPTRDLIWTRQVEENLGAILDRTRPIQGSVVGEGGTITDIL